MTNRPIAKVHTTSDFEKSFRKLPAHIQDLAVKKDRWFRADAFDQRLRTHRLKGALEGYWSYSINRQFRVLFGSSLMMRLSITTLAHTRSIVSLREVLRKA